MKWTPLDKIALILVIGYLFLILFILVRPIIIYIPVSEKGMEELGNVLEAIQLLIAMYIGNKIKVN
jgi:hypothetical protein